ncbi:hypothetical protein [Salipiger thiooxidans]|uniref:hypothetical protein n=1 Tax=Salipiger thiooxidans TaxID=282683 RepID=UPI00104274C0|nr:hypothetical protein [Salipiger thiooxidans]
MSEDIINLLAPVPRWRLSGHDAGIVDDLKEVIRFWLPALTDAEDLSCAVVMLRDLDGIVAGQTCLRTIHRDTQQKTLRRTLIWISMEAADLGDTLKLHRCGRAWPSEPWPAAHAVFASSRLENFPRTQGT